MKPKLRLASNAPITRGALEELDPESWPLWRKKVPTRAIKVDGPFEVVSSETPRGETFLCEDGYLAVDARGYPYAIATEEFNLIYELDPEDNP